MDNRSPEIDMPIEKSSTLGRSLLSVRNVGKTYRTDLFVKAKPAVRDLSLELVHGRINALLGHNGAGKTTTIRMILGLIKPDKGQIEFRGEPLRDDHRYHFGYMPETNKLPQELTAEELLRFHVQFFKKPWSKDEIKSRIDLALDKVGLGSAHHKRVKKLSKGMGRRLAWAQATIHEPELLILDEPFSGLDPVGMADMASWIRELRMAGRTILLCTHDFWAVDSLAETVQIVRNGELAHRDLNFADLDATSGSGENNDSRSIGEGNYNIRMSGANESLLSDLASKWNLPIWKKFERQGFAGTLSFSSYGDAAKWLRILIDNGVVVLEFNDSVAKKAEGLLQFFDTTQSQPNLSKTPENK